jgi:hypothetical protein
MVGRALSVEEELAGQGGEDGFLSRLHGTGEAVEVGFGGGIPGWRATDGGLR